MYRKFISVTDLAFCTLCSWSYARIMYNNITPQPNEIDICSHASSSMPHIKQTGFTQYFDILVFPREKVALEVELGSLLACL